MFKFLTAIVEGLFKLMGWMLLSAVVLFIYMSSTGIIPQ
jgi:hypothetical protein